MTYRLSTDITTVVKGSLFSKEPARSRTAIQIATNNDKKHRRTELRRFFELMEILLFSKECINAVFNKRFSSPLECKTSQQTITSERGTKDPLE